MFSIGWDYSFCGSKPKNLIFVQKILQHGREKLNTTSPGRMSPEVSWIGQQSDLLQLYPSIWDQTLGTVLVLLPLSLTLIWNCLIISITLYIIVFTVFPHLCSLVILLCQVTCSVSLYLLPQVWWLRVFHILFVASSFPYVVQSNETILYPAKKSFFRTSSSNWLRIA